jgi:uracil-DNA glycosylase
LLVGERAVSLPALMARSSRQIALERHVAELRQCRRCPRVMPPPVSGGALLSDIMLIGQAPGVREPILARPFAHTAGKTLFRWFEEFCGMSEELVRARIYFAAVIRCFPGKSSSGGGDRVPAPDEIANCSCWLNNELELLQPRLIIPVGRLAIAQFIPIEKLEDVIGRKFQLKRGDRRIDLIPLPHPSGASPWPKLSPGKELLAKAMRKIARHPAMRKIRQVN